MQWHFPRPMSNLLNGMFSNAVLVICTSATETHCLLMQGKLFLKSYRLENAIVAMVGLYGDTI